MVIKHEKARLMTQQDRLTVDLLGYRTALDAFAERTHRTAAGCLRYFLEEGLKREAPDLLDPPAENETESLSAKFLRGLANGDAPKNGELIQLAHLLDVPVEVLLSIRDRCLFQEEVERNAENFTK